mgnify:CR=1 FL=1
MGGESLVASRVVEDYGEMGVITANTAYTHKWHSENDFTYNSGQRNLAVLAEEHIRLRGAARDTYAMRFLVCPTSPLTHNKVYRRDSKHLYETIYDVSRYI